MDTEIELKFLVSEHAESALPQLVDTFVQTHQGMSVEQSRAHLSNTYFDTSDGLLRKNDIGLRVRSADGRFEQTIKTAGKVVAGLHQRPEYNIPINDETPKLALFERDILPLETAVDELQASLIPLFTTDFVRRKWKIEGDAEAFELVFDQGNVASCGQHEAICEIELELCRGDGETMFAFARTLVEALAPVEGDDGESQSTIRLGFQSKAARGYQLYHDSQLEERSDLGQVPLDPNDSMESAFVKTLEYGLAFMQHHEQCFIDNPNLLALRRFTDGAALIRHGMWLFSSVVAPEKVEHFRHELKWILKSFTWVEHARQLQALKSQRGKFRKRLDKSEALSRIVEEESEKDPKLEDVKLFFSHPRYIGLLLELSRWLLNKDWRQAAEPVPQTSSLDDMAAQMLNRAWQSLLDIMPKKDSLTVDDYVFHHKQLKRSLMTGTSVGGLYVHQIRDDFRMPWLDLSRGIDELKTLDLLKSLANRVEDKKCHKTLEWLDAQIETLLMAMEQSRKSAVKMKTYWALA